MANLAFEGAIYATPTAATILVDGTEVHSGQIGAGESLDTLFNMLLTSAGNSSVSISVTSGVLGVGAVYVQPTTTFISAHTYPSGSTVVDGTEDGLVYVSTQAVPANTSLSNTTYWSQTTSYSPDARVSSSILINGVDPEWPATPVVPMPGGTQESPNWDNWVFEISAGEAITFNIEV